MRTTVDLPEVLLHTLKAMAAQQRITLSQLIVDVLRAQLEDARREDPPFELIVRGRPDGTPPTPSQLQRLLEEDDMSSLK